MNVMLIYNEIVKCVNCARDLERGIVPVTMLLSTMASSTYKIIELLNLEAKDNE